MGHTDPPHHQHADEDGAQAQRCPQVRLNEDEHSGYDYVQDAQKYEAEATSERRPLRKYSPKRKNKEAEAALALISPLEAAFKKSMDRQTPDLDAAPSELCRKAAALQLAIQAADNKAFNKAARELYPLVKEYDTQKIPLGKKLMHALLTPPKNVDNTDVQCEVLADQLARWNQPGCNRRIKQVAHMILHSRTYWRPFAIHKRHRDIVIKWSPSLK